MGECAKCLYLRLGEAGLGRKCILNSLVLSHNTARFLAVGRVALFCEHCINRNFVHNFLCFSFPCGSCTIKMNETSIFPKSLFYSKLILEVRFSSYIYFFHSLIYLQTPIFHFPRPQFRPILFLTHVFEIHHDWCLILYKFRFMMIRVSSQRNPLSSQISIEI